MHGLGDDGFSLIEVIVAAAILTISVVALLTSVTAGFSAIDLGRQQSTAVFLAEQRLEQARAFNDGTAAGQGFANLTSATYPAENYGGIPNYPQYRRTVTVTNSPGGVVDTKLIVVSVFYRPQTESTGMPGESSVVVSTLVARHQ